LRVTQKKLGLLYKQGREVRESGDGSSVNEIFQRAGKLRNRVNEIKNEIKKLRGGE
jgi:hypothetical protein